MSTDSRRLCDCKVKPSGACLLCGRGVCAVCAGFSKDGTLWVCRPCVQPVFVFVAAFVPSDGGTVEFAHHEGQDAGRECWPICSGCGCDAATISPCELDHVGPLPNGSALCERCSMRLPLLPGYVRELWPALTAAQVEGLWDGALRARVAEVGKVAGRGAKRG